MAQHRAKLPLRNCTDSAPLLRRDRKITAGSLSSPHMLLSNTDATSPNVKTNTTPTQHQDRATPQSDRTDHCWSLYQLF